VKRAAFALLLLSACAEPAQDVYNCDCVLIPTEEETIARTGFPSALIYMEGGDFIEADKTHMSEVQFDATKATPAMIAAAPAALCAAEQRSLVSSTVVPPDPDDMDIEGSMIVRAICK
jgi:hypothetical protein